MKRITMVTSKSVRMADSVANSFHFHANPTPAEPKNKKFKIHFSNLPIIIYDFFFGRREPPLLYYHVVYPYINPPLISFVFISTFRLSNSGGVDGRYRTSGDSAWRRGIMRKGDRRRKYRIFNHHGRRGNEIQNSITPGRCVICVYWNFKIVWVVDNGNFFVHLKFWFLFQLNSNSSIS